MVIHFFPGHLGTKPDTLTRHPNLYLKEWGKDFGKVNPSNFKPIFSSKILSESLQASVLLPTALHGIIAMDVDKLNKEIISALHTDEAVLSYLADINKTQYGRWSKDTLGFIQIDKRIYVPPSSDLCLRVLCSYHDHPVSGHFGINKTLELIRREYTWPSIHTFVTDYCRSCTTCSWNKAKRHKPYSLLRQLPVPSHLWNSISMDFIEHLPVSEGFTTILVVVDHFAKQSIFIPTHDTITSTQLAELFIIHVFSKHSLPSHVTSDCGSEFVSHFFRSLGKALDMKLHFTSSDHLEGNGQTECVSQTLEQYIQIFTNYQQDNWSFLLPLAEFSYNNAPNATTGVSPFFANKGYDLAINCKGDCGVGPSRILAGGPKFNIL